MPDWLLTMTSGCPRSMPQAQALRGSRQEAQLRRIVEVAAIDHDGAVAIEDHGARRRRRAHALLLAVMRRMVSLVLCAGSSSASTTLPPRRQYDVGPDDGLRPCSPRP